MQLMQHFFYTVIIYIYIYLTKGYSRYCLRYCRCYTSECCFLCMGFWWTAINTSATWQGAGWSHSGFFPRPWDVSFSKKAELLKKKRQMSFPMGFLGSTKHQASEEWPWPHCQCSFRHHLPNGHRLPPGRGKTKWFAPTNGGWKRRVTEAFDGFLSAKSWRLW